MSGTDSSLREKNARHAMILHGSNGNEFELAFIRDSFAGVQDGSGDAAWVTVTWSVATADDSWEESSPCLNVFEFRNLAEWLDALSAIGGGVPELGEVELLQPELKFSVSNLTKAGVTVRVSFQLDNRPEEMNVDSATDLQYVDLFVTRDQLRGAAKLLLQDIQDIERANEKDDLDGDSPEGIMGVPDETLSLVDGSSRRPPGAGFGVDNAGNR
jgi:hypothetical protein